MNKKQYIVILIAIFSLIGFAFKSKINGQVVCFGDSITYGAQVDGRSWVSFLSEKHPEINFINAGRSGRKTSDRKELLPVLNKYPNANYYTIFLGVNDLKDGTDSMVNGCIENMKWMIAEIHSVNPTAKIVILAPADINLKTMNQINIQKKYNTNTKNALFKLEKRYKELAEQENIGFISLLHAVKNPNYTDGLHPNLKGQLQISTAVWKGLTKL